MTTQPRTTSKGMSRTRKLWIVDVSLLAAFLLVMNTPLTGVPIHEWLGIAIGVGLIVHLLQHGNWLATLTQRFRSATSFRNRLNYVMTGLLFVAFVSIIISGLVISESALPWMGIATSEAAFWLWLHLVSIDFVLLLTALHIALNWAWIVKSFDRFVRQPVAAMSASRQPSLAYQSQKELS